MVLCSIVLNYRHLFADIVYDSRNNVHYLEDKMIG